MKYFTICMIILLPASCVLAQEYQTDFPPEEFRARWNKVFDRIGDEAVAVIQGAPDPGGYIFPRQSNTFYYLCGVENMDSYLLLDGRNRTATLYLKHSRRSSWEKVLSLEKPERVKELTGVDNLLNSNELKRIRASVIYTPFRRAVGTASSTSAVRDGISREAFFVSQLLSQNPQAEIKNLSPIMTELRSIKSPREIEMLRRAGKLAALGIIEAIRSTKSGVYEYQLDGAARYTFLLNGARLEGYRSITAAGSKNIIDAHYYYNSCRLKDGDLVLMDFAPDCGYYTSDIGRMWPVNGKFSKWQREICQFILEYHKAILSRIRPGVTSKQIMNEAEIAMEPVFERTKFSKPEYEKAARQLVEKGGGVFSHTVGMEVHDDATYKDSPLKPGQVFAVDPQLWVKKEGLYLRVEDTVVVTEDGVEVLTGLCPTELEELEKIVGKNGLVQIRPAALPIK